MLWFVLLRCARITPAYAGKRAFCKNEPKAGKDHPRVCGEKKRLASCAQSAEGSPPRMRGKAAAARAGLVAVGITPAYAGKRSVKDLGAGELWDHPRVCGEKAGFPAVPTRELGSPPRMRGKVKEYKRKKGAI